MINRDTPAIQSASPMLVAVPIQSRRRFADSRERYQRTSASSFAIRTTARSIQQIRQHE
jgi:hypothetical protein